MDKEKLEDHWGRPIISSGKRIRSTKPVISITKNGLISFNSAFCKLNISDVTKIKGVEIYYFEKMNYLAFKLLIENESKNMIRANINNKVSFNISASSFFIEIKKKVESLVGKYDIGKKVLSEIGEVHYINLNAILHEFN